jgi:hypothetical protein
MNEWSDRSNRPLGYSALSSTCYILGELLSYGMRFRVVWYISSNV